jgi:Holliday junction resolvase-like predicted endonuclease
VIYKNCLNFKHKNGIQAELLVSKLLKSKTNIQLYHRLKSPFGELDIITFDSDRNISLFEVKSVPDFSWAFDRISKSQVNRLKKCHEWVLAKTNISAKLEFVFVEKTNVQRFPILIGDL